MVLATASPAPPPGAPNRKRHGQHHKASRRYVKTYWPYLPMLLVVLVGFIINMGLSAGPGVLGYATNISPTGLLQETNIQRSGGGLSALSLNNQLSQAAQQKANDMAARNYWSHASPEGTQPWQLISAAGYAYTAAGENLAYGFDSSSGTLAGWMNSAAHRANVLSSGYTDVGFGIANAANFQGDGEQTIVVAMYGSPKRAAAPAPVAQKPKPARKSEAPALAPKTEPPTPAPAAAAPAPPAPAAPTTIPQPKEPAPPPSTPSIQQLTPKEVARVDILTPGNAEWAALAVTALIAICAVTFVYRHLRMWRCFLTRGEKFVIRHPVLDTVVVAVITAGIILTGTSGFIH